jgi:hypothetical protein
LDLGPIDGLAAARWAPTAAGPFLEAHLKSLSDYLPRQSTDTPSRSTRRCARSASTSASRTAVQSTLLLPRHTVSLLSLRIPTGQRVFAFEP